MITPLPSAANVRTVERVTAWMQENLSRNITIDDMARVAAYSKFHFTRIFREVTGLTPGRYLTKLRMEEAERLLRCSSYSVSEICDLVGFASQGTFSYNFKAAFGVAPTQYRQTHDCPEVLCA